MRRNNGSTDIDKKAPQRGADGILVLNERTHCEHGSCIDVQGVFEHSCGTGIVDLGGRRVSNETVGAQCAHMSRSGQDNQAVASGHVIPTNGVRRLTPLECERLQGLPDNYTLVDEKSSDTARYKAIGNGMAQPCADFILSVIRRMADD